VTTNENRHGGDLIPFSAMGDLFGPSTSPEYSGYEGQDHQQLSSRRRSVTREPPTSSAPEISCPFFMQTSEGFRRGPDWHCRIESHWILFGALTLGRSVASGCEHSMLWFCQYQPTPPGNLPSRKALGAHARPHPLSVLAEAWPDIRRADWRESERISEFLGRPALYRCDECVRRKLQAGRHPICHINVGSLMLGTVYSLPGGDRQRNGARDSGPALLDPIESLRLRINPR